MKVQSVVPYIFAVTGILIVLLLIIHQKLKNYDPMEKPKGLVLLMIMAVQMVDDMCRKDTNPEIAENLGPYIGSIFAYIFLANISGLLGFENPTSNLSVTLALAGITVCLIEINSIKYNGVKNYVHSLFEPVAPFVVMNIIGKISPLLSLSMRLCCNIIAGSIIMQIIYAGTATISKAIPVIGQFNFLGVALAPVFHAYFDLFAGVLQAYIFITLTIMFIGKELPKE